MPAVFADCTDDMEFVTDEVFGPLMSVLPFDTEDEVVERANATPYGLSAAVFSSDFARANRVANALAGRLGVDQRLRHAARRRCRSAATSSRASAVRTARMRSSTTRRSR